MSTAQAGERTRKPLGWKRIVGYAISVVIVVGIFWWAIPKFADYRDVWAAIKTLTPIETWSLVAATIFNLVTLLVGEPGGPARPRHRQGRRAHADDDLGREHAPGGRRDRRRADVFDPRLLGIQPARAWRCTSG